MRSVVSYHGNAEDIIGPAEKMGWIFEEEKYLDPDGCINWDRVLDEATDFLRTKGITICYN